jgi:hypothetical protein
LLFVLSLQNHKFQTMQILHSINCPNCKQEISIPDDRITRVICFRCFTSVPIKDQEVDNTDNSREQDYIQRDYSNTNSYNTTPHNPPTPFNWGCAKWVGGALLAITAFIYWDDYSDFKEVQKNPTISTCRDYMSEHGSGGYREEVYVLHDKLEYEDLVAGASKNLAVDSLSCDCTPLHSYITKYNTPDGSPQFKKELLQTYQKCMLRNIQTEGNLKDWENIKDHPLVHDNADTLVRLENQVWKIIHQRYDKMSLGASAKNKAIFHEIIDFVRYKNKEIDIYFESSVNVKDWEDFDARAQKLVSALTSNNDDDLPSIEESKPISASGVFRVGLYNLENSFKEQLSEKFAKVFGKDFIRFTAYSEGSDIIAESNKDKQGGVYGADKIRLFAKYKAENQLLIQSPAVPNIFIYSQTDENPIAAYYMKMKRAQMSPEQQALFDEEVKEQREKKRKENKFLGYLLGINLKWDIHLIAPGSKIDVRQKTTLSPADESTSHGDADDAYRTMVNSCFERSSNLFLNEFGL